jgi:hypothetical protein
MLSFLKKIFGAKPVDAKATAPYKIETPTPVSEQAAQAVVKSIAPAKKKPAAKKAPAAKKPAAKKKTKSE